MEIYLYNPENGEFTHKELAVESPAEKDVYLIPAFATTIAPPSVAEGEVAGFSGDGWTVRKRQTSPPRTPQEARAAKLAEIKNTAAAILTASDYKVQRHMEETALEMTTSLSSSEYQALLQQRQNVRRRSNALELELSKIPDIANMIDALKIVY